MRWSVWALVLAGIWLIVAPFVIGYSATRPVATYEAIVAGLVVVTLAGIWSIAAPFVLGYSGAELARNSDILAGIVVAVIAIARTLQHGSPAMLGRKVTV